MNLPKLKVMPCPIWAGRHPYHEHRFIATADAVAEIDNPEADPGDQDFSMESGRIVAAMTDCEGQAELATLFAAAPELLEALQELVDLEVCRNMHRARAAVAKARGTPGKEPAVPAPTPDRLPDALTALQECVDLLKNSNVRFKICDGGRGNLGEAARYHSAINKAHAVLYTNR